MKDGFNSQSTSFDYLTVIEQLSKELSLLPKTSATYGLLHFDYELDNLILNTRDHQIYTIDFDDACYGWYDLDIIIAVKNIIEESSYKDFLYVKHLFLEGYQANRTYLPLSESQHLTLMRFESLYQYFRIIRSVEETYDNEPEWMIALRKKLNTVSTTLSNRLETL